MYSSFVSQCFSGGRFIKFSSFKAVQIIFRQYRSRLRFDIARDGSAGFCQSGLAKEE